MLINKQCLKKDEQSSSTSHHTMKKAELIFIPHAATGHLLSTIEFVKLLLERDDRFSVTVLVMRLAAASTVNFPFETNIRFIELPEVEPPPSDLFSKSFEKYLCDIIASYRTHVKDAMVKQVLPGSPRIAGFVVDFFCMSMLDVANELGLQSYMFYTSGAGSLGFMLYLPIWHDKVHREFEESDPDSIIPSYKNPVPTSCLPSVAFNKEGGYSCVLNLVRRYKEIKGIIVNTFQELEHYAFSALSVYDVPPVYTVGPLIKFKNHQSNHESDRSEHDKIMKWLDDQPDSSVVFLCFGSCGNFDVAQLREIALGLEQSGHRFLWSVRDASNEKKHDKPESNFLLAKKPEANLHHEILLEDFQERTKDKGLIICGWAPQVEALAHKAVGGFVSHCGWNSILESVWFGVPVVTLPLYAEQQINAFEMVKELGLAIELKLDNRSDRDEIVKAKEIEKAVKCVMEAESEVRKKVKDMSEKSRKALMVGGSSFVSLGHLVDNLLA